MFCNECGKEKFDHSDLNANALDHWKKCRRSIYVSFAIKHSGKHNLLLH